MNETTKNRYAVVDLEATGTGVQASIIQVGIVLIDGEGIVGSYETDVNPHELLDRHIVELTGITDEQLSKAPPFSQVARQIYELIEGRIFVAHNVQFDANLLAEQLFLEGFDLQSPRIDTVELTQICFPQLDKFNLSLVCEQLGIPLSSAHTAIADATATAQLFLQILKKLQSLPQQTVATLAELSDCLLYETGQVFDGLQGQEPLPAHLETIGGLVLRRPHEPVVGSPLSGEMAEQLSQLGLSYRSQQASFAKAVSEGAERPLATFIEGPAGLGKTYGYLLPLLSRTDIGQLVLAVPTKLLQDQLMANEGRALFQTFGTHFASLKSSRNYLDITKFAHRLMQKETNRLISRYKMLLLIWLLETETGDLDDIRQKMGMDAYFDQLAHDGRDRSQSPFAQFDFWYRAKKSAASSQVLVTNHAFLLATLQDKPDYLQGKTLVVDEAQQFFLAMESSWRQRLQLTPTLLDINQLLTQERNLLNRRLLERLQHQLNTLVTKHYQEKQDTLRPEELESIRQDLAELQHPALEPLAELLSPHFSEHWLETKRRDGKRETELVAARFDFFDLKPYVNQAIKSYFISATVHISKRVKLPDLMGLTDYEVVTLAQEPSDQQLILLDQGMVELTSPTHLEALVGRLVAMADIGLPMVVLLTSWQSLLALSEQLSELGVGHLAQGKHGEPWQLKKRFDRGDQQLLLGTGSFWEGVDFAQQERLVMVIPKLPFDNPKDQVIQKLNRYLKAEGKQPFYDYALPVAGLRLKQALGRGKRRDNQRSVIVLLDHRLTDKPYGKTLVKGLTKLAPVKSENFAQILSEIQDFCYNKKVL